ncbi:hypothetical protein [Neorhodopirellula lusitana]|uniref:hypothetical protein n=1 Tax=Neorhodopirellula lusitana TaxID=445327 RepID=UPI0024B70750|nr:hypothetical protein [Neorhodopirellula lusitana]
MTQHRAQLSLRRTAVAFAVLAIVFAYYRNLPFAGMTIGFLVGVPAFFIALLVRRDQLLEVLRCYLYAGVCAIIAASISAPIHIPTTIGGGIFGWGIAVMRNQFIRVRRIKASAADIHVDTSDYGL